MCQPAHPGRACSCVAAQSKLASYYTVVSRALQLAGRNARPPPSRAVPAAALPAARTLPGQPAGAGHERRQGLPGGLTEPRIEHGLKPGDTIENSWVKPL